VERGSREKRGYLRETGAGDSGETTERGETWDNDRREGTACQMIGWRQFRCLLVEGQAVGGIRRDHDEEPLTPCRDPRRQGRVDHQLRPQHLPLDQDRRCRPTWVSKGLCVWIRGGSRMSIRADAFYRSLTRRPFWPLVSSSSSRQLAGRLARRTRRGPRDTSTLVEVEFGRGVAVVRGPERKNCEWHQGRRVFTEKGGTMVSLAEIQWLGS
jgi:hypothetical protein